MGELWPFERFLIGDSHTALGDLQSDRENVRHTWLFVALWTIAQKAPLSMEFSRQEYWSGLPFPSPGDRPNPGMKPESPALQADS